MIILNIPTFQLEPAKCVNVFERMKPAFFVLADTYI